MSILWTMTLNFESSLNTQISLRNKITVHFWNNGPTLPMCAGTFSVMTDYPFYIFIQANLLIYVGYRDYEALSSSRLSHSPLLTHNLLGGKSKCPPITDEQHDSVLPGNAISEPGTPLERWLKQGVEVFITLSLRKIRATMESFWWWRSLGQL